jgi:hypothetical protein
MWLLALLPVMVVVYFLPPVHDRLAWRIDNLRTEIRYLLDPPNEAVFVPTQSVDFESVLATTRAEFLQTLTPAATATPRPGPTARPTQTFTPLPEKVELPGVVYVDQHNRWNYCGPANLTMGLKFWGWDGTRDDVARVVKPGTPNTRDDFIERGKPDKNVMPYELVDFVNGHTDLRALMRYGGDVELLKSLIAAGFPVIVEKGYYEANYLGRGARRIHRPGRLPRAGSQSDQQLSDLRRRLARLQLSLHGGLPARPRVGGDALARSLGG